MYLINPTSVQSNSNITLLSVPIYARDGQVDVQVKAMIGHDSQVWGTQPPNSYYNISGGVYKHPAVAFVIDSGWNET